MRIRRLVIQLVSGVVAVGAVAAGILLLTVQRGWWEPAPAGGATTARLISPEQYATAIHELFGQDIQIDISLALPPRHQGLINLGAATAEITPAALEEFEREARRVAMQVVDEAHRTALVPCEPASQTRSDDSCAGKFLERAGRLLYRRPLTITELRAATATAAALTRQSADFYAGLGYALAGMLTTPKFLYYLEFTEPDPKRSGYLRLNAFSKATRLSLFLWNAPPDNALLEAAESGELHTRRGLERQVDRMLASSRLDQGVRAFFSDLLNFDKFDTLSKDPVIYPEFTRSVATSAEEQALKVITDYLIVRRGDYRDLFTTRDTFINATLAALYDASVPNPYDWVPFEMDSRDSAGLLASPAFLALNSHPGVSSPTRRGRAVREILLCQKVPDPPPNVSFTVFEDAKRNFKTARQRLEAHSTDGVCAGCHKLTDPIGLAFENFDGAGVFRAGENGVPIDATGVLDGRGFKDTASFGRALHDHPALAPCLATRLYAYGVGREAGASDRPWLGWIAKRFAVNGYRLPDLLREVATSRGFFAVSGPAPPAIKVAASNERRVDQS